MNNYFSEALGAGLGPAKGADYDAIVDWGGGSYKVYVHGKRVCTEVMDANTLLCEAGALDHERLQEGINEIESLVLEIEPSARHILIAQTGKAREIALRDNT